MLSHRPYSTGLYFGEPGQYYPDSMYTSAADVVAVVEHCGEDGSAVLTQRNKFTRGDTLELLLPDREPLRFRAEELDAAARGSPRVCDCAETELRNYAKEILDKSAADG